MPFDEGFVEVTVRIPASCEEVVCNFLIDHITGGNGLVIEEDGSELQIRLYIHSDQDASVSIDKLREFIRSSSFVSGDKLQSAITSRNVRQIDWVEAYRKSFEPTVIDDIVVRSVWNEQVYPEKLGIVIEPKMAFGTGKHETTQLCLMALREAVKKGDRVLDLGTGSGILAILAAKLGASEVLALDTDSDSIQNARENLVLNGVSSVADCRVGSMEQVDRIDYYDVVVSNLIKDGIIELFDRFASAVRDGGNLILSGILKTQVDDMSDFFDKMGYRKRRVTELGEWVCYIIGVGK
jgi:ribosomal protein L11 methyltransferase